MCGLLNGGNISWMNALTIFGTRPEAIKLAPVIRELKKHSEFSSRVCVTAQHRQMLDQVLDLFGIEPDWDLDLMLPNQSLFQVTSRGLQLLEGVLEEERPEIVLVQGDTTTTFVGALAAYYLMIRVGHVEAGLRTGDKFSPFPEEINRRLADALADLCFAPTEAARGNLLHEGVPQGKIFVTGNTVIDALLWMVERQARAEVQEQFNRKFIAEYGIETEGKKLVLVTGHRRESFQRFEEICYGLKMIAERNQDVEIVYPAHLNPNVQRPVRQILGDVERVHLVEPQDYQSFVWLMSRAYLILTDSGGIQEEAPALGKPVLVMRERTERPEAIAAGTARLVGVERNSIFEGARLLLDNSSEYAKMAHAANPYGDGYAAERIVDIIRAQAS